MVTTMRTQIEALIDDLRASHGRNLAAVILYGSAAAGDFVPENSDHNLLIALHRIAPSDLRDAHACIREWAKLGNPVPVYFTVAELQEAADVFPIEFHQMEKARRVLYGSDVLAGLEINDRYLRHQTEYELRSRLLQLRRSYIPASTSLDGLLNLMSDSLSSFAVLFRAVLLLYGMDAPAKKHEVVAATVEKLNLSGIPFEKIFNIRENNFAEILDENSANRLFADYIEQIEKVIDAVDKMDEAGSGDPARAA